MSASLKNVGAITLFVQDAQKSKLFYQDIFDVKMVYEDEQSAALDLGTQPSICSSFPQHAT